MADDSKLSAKPEIDTTEFKTGVATMNRELKVLESGFKASAASLGDWSKSAEGLDKRLDTLTEKFVIQEKKVAATRAEYERIAAEKGKTSRAAQDLEIQLNKEIETLGKMSNESRNIEEALEEMSSGSDEAGEAVEDLGNATEETSESLITFKDVANGLGAAIQASVGAVLALGAATAAAAVAISGLVFSTAQAAGDLVDMSVKTGISTEALQEYAFIGGQVGVSLDTITGAQAKMIRSMAGAKDGTGAQADAFKNLGISVTDSSGQLRDSQTVFAETLDALGKISNPAEKDAMAMDIFGKSAQELNPLIAAGSEGMAEMAANAHELGAVMDDDTIAAGDKLGDTMDALKAGLQGTLGTLAGGIHAGISGRV